MTKRLRKLMSWPLIVSLLAWGTLWISLVLPAIRLDSSLSLWTWRLTMTGGFLGATLVSIACAVLLALRTSRARGRIARELMTHVIVLGILLGGGALANEYLLKPAFTVPRPNVIHLAEDGTLGMSAEIFYSSIGKEERQAHLASVLSDDGSPAADLSPSTRTHWIHEAGYSFPSGHAFSAMFLAAYFLTLAGSITSSRLKRISFVLPFWAVLIGWSRVLLGVHRPEDVVWGGLLGLSLGVAASGLWRKLTKRPSS
jgi:phosphatidylglycerophosphatase B